MSKEHSWAIIGRMGGHEVHIYMSKDEALCVLYYTGKILGQDELLARMGRSIGKEKLEHIMEWVIRTSDMLDDRRFVVEIVTDKRLYPEQQGVSDLLEKGDDDGNIDT